MSNLRSCSSLTFILVFFHIHILVTSYLTYTQGFDYLTRSKRVLFVSDFGAKGNGLQDDTKAFQDAWKIACSLHGRVKLVFPSGNTFLVYPIDITGPCRSKITLMILGTIVAPKDPDVWNGLDRRKWLYFQWVNHLTVEGGGTVNGMGKEWWARSCKINPTNPCQLAPTAITFHRCRNLKVRNLILLNSQQVHVSFTRCRRVAASHLKVLAPAFSPNTDGVHISASNGVEVKNSLIKTGDDCISIVSNSSRIRIRNISCGPGHGISIGSLGKSNSWEKVQDVIVDGAFLYKTDNGVRIKTWQGGGGFASNITFQNVLMEKVSNPITIDQYYCDSAYTCQNQSSAVKVKNISFINIKGTSATEKAIKFACSDASPCESLRLEDIFLEPCCGGVTRSYCWEAHGSTLSLVHPPACFPRCKNCQVGNTQVLTDNQEEVSAKQLALKTTRAGLNHTIEANTP